MAVEVILGYHRFNVDPKAYAESRMKELNEGSLKESTAHDNFSHNALHDLESLWWVCVWELLFYNDKSWDQMMDEDIQRRQDAVDKLFPGTTKVTHRLGFLEEGHVFYKMLQWMPEDYSIFKLRLDVLRAHLILWYATHNRAMDCGKLDGAHGMFADMFWEWSDLACEKNVQSAHSISRRLKIGG